MNYSEAMLHAIELAKLGTGYVSPNPRVGAVILDENGEIIGEGWHKKYGGPHAEVEAIRSGNRDNFDGCTIVVTLEPCSHTGKTPPCADLIIDNKFSKVVVGTLDKNPLVSGKGVELIRKSGIEVIVGVEQEQCEYLNRAFFKFVNQGVPYIILKVAQSIDGNIALSNGESKWITSSESRSKVQSLRADCDAILVGTNTIIADNPSLNVRELDLPSPKKIILDKELYLPFDLKVFSEQDKNKIIVFHHSDNLKKIQLYEEKGFKTEKISLNENGHLSIAELVKILGKKYQITSLLVEGGARIYSSFLSEKLADEIHFYVAPKIIGSGINTFGQFKLSELADAPELKVIKNERLGSDYLFETKVIYH